MAVLDIKRAGDPILKKVSEPVKRIDKKVKRILKDMTDTLYKSGNGIGLIADAVSCTVTEERNGSCAEITSRYCWTFVSWAGSSRAGSSSDNMKNPRRRIPQS